MSVDFLLCRRCGVLSPLPDVGEEARSEEAPGAGPDLATFCAEHEGHRLDWAIRLPDSATYDRPPWDPMATSWFQVAAGGETLTVRSWRPSIDAPRHRQVQDSPPAAADGSVEIDAVLLRRGLQAHFYPQTLTAAKTERFVGAIRELVGTLDIDCLATSFADPDCANADFAPFPAVLRDQLIAMSTAIFDAWEMDRLVNFVAGNCSECGALALRVHRPTAQ